jgi:hypothetical protein
VKGGELSASHPPFPQRTRKRVGHPKKSGFLDFVGDSLREPATALGMTEFGLGMDWAVANCSFVCVVGTP